MTLTIILLVLCSAFLHPLWNLLAKKDNEPQFAFITLSFGIAVVGLIHGLLIGANFWLNADQWMLISASVAGQLLYNLALAATLKRGDLSAYYPIIRASPVFIVAFSFLVLGIHYSLLVLVGITLVLIGAVLLLYRRGHNLLDDGKTLGLATLAMCATGIYSLADSRLMLGLEPPVLFFWTQLICWPLLVTANFLMGNRPPRFMGLSRLVEKPFLNAQLIACVYGSYILILIAYSMGGDVAIVTTIRQASIPLSVILGGYFLNEGAIARRLIASAILSAGIITVILYG
ncbi:EamA family transporter [Sneathiella sp.]|uniref:EamA family transporter n=1 Tax=Sneathiella sp. TaxID=1964365 RepID=UPI0039E2E1D5